MFLEVTSLGCRTHYVGSSFHLFCFCYLYVRPAFQILYGSSRSNISRSFLQTSLHCLSFRMGHSGLHQRESTLPKEYLPSAALWSCRKDAISTTIPYFPCSQNRYHMNDASNFPISWGWRVFLLDHSRFS